MYVRMYVFMYVSVMNLCVIVINFKTTWLFGQITFSLMNAYHANIIRRTSLS